MDPDLYQRKAMETAFPYKEAARDIAQDPVLAEKVIRIMYTGIGLGEAGEAQEITKKHVRAMRQTGNSDHTLTYHEARAKKLSELGDLMWYIANDAAEWNIKLSEIMEHNIAKLQARLNAGSLAHEDRQA